LLLHLGASISCGSGVTLGMLVQEAIMVMLFTLLIPAPALVPIIAIFKKSTITYRLVFFLTICVI